MYWGGEPHTFHGAVSHDHTANVTVDRKFESGEVERRISEGRMFVPKGTTVGKFRSKERMGRLVLICLKRAKMLVWLEQSEQREDKQEMR